MTLKELIETCGSERALARRLGFSQSHVNSIARGVARPSFEFMARVWTEFGIVLDIRSELDAWNEKART